jgi:glycosyltransferase involved in cell wall biosynthesis
MIAEPPLRILHVIATLARASGGPAQACLDMARALARRGHDVTILTTDLDTPDAAPAGEPVVRDGVTIVSYPVHFPVFWRTSLPLGRALGEAVARADLVHVHSFYLFHDLAAWFWCRRRGVPYIVQPHGVLDPYLYRRHRARKALIDALYQDRMLQDAAAIMYTTEEERLLAEPHARGAKGVVVPLGLDPDDYADPPPAGHVAARFPELAGKRLVLHFGRLNFKKGLDVLVDAFARLAATRADVHLVLAGGDDGMEAQVRAWLAERGLAARATFTGLLGGADKLAALTESHVFALPSYSENFGIAVIEALACGTPVVISDRVNIWREITGAEAGLAGPPEAGATADNLARLLDDDALRARMAANGRRLVAGKFDWAAIGAELAAAYRRCLGRP